MPGLSERTACLLLRVPRSSMRPETEKVPAYAVVDELLAERIRRLIELHPTYGYRLLWAMLRKDGVRVNRKAVYRILRLKRWLVVESHDVVLAREASRASGVLPRAVWVRRSL